MNIRKHAPSDPSGEPDVHRHGFIMAFLPIFRSILSFFFFYVTPSCYIARLPSSEEKDTLEVPKGFCRGKIRII